MTYKFDCEHFASQIQDLYAEFENPPIWKLQSVLDDVELISDQKSRDLVFLTVRDLLKGDKKDIAQLAKKRADKAFGAHSGVADEVHQIAVALISALRRDSMADPSK